MAVAEAPLDLPRVWVEFTDPDDAGQRFRCDLTWLTSSWTCIFGTGCRGIYADRPDDGCCTLGAHFTDGADLDRVSAVVAELGEDEWQYHDVGTATGRRRDWTEKEDGARKTRVVDGACIFLNRPGFEGGTGCALHIAALEAGERPLDWKPNVCWQVPIRLEHSTDDNGHVTSRLREWKRRDWGDGGAEFHWWCTEAPEAFSAAEPVYKTSRDEIVELVSQPIYDLMVEQLERPNWVPLPHPTVRTRR